MILRFNQSQHMIASMNTFYLCTFILLIGGCFCINEEGTSGIQQLPGSSSHSVPPVQNSGQIPSPDDKPISQSKSLPELREICHEYFSFLDNVPRIVDHDTQGADVGHPRSPKQLEPSLSKEQCQSVFRKSRISRPLSQRVPMKKKKKPVTQPKARKTQEYFTEVQKNIVKNWLDNHPEENPNTEAMKDLAKKTGMSSKAIRRKMTYMRRNDDPKTSRSYKTSHQRSILRTWLNDHEGRYPNKAELNSLVKEVNASPGAVRRWFYNERVSVDKQNKKKQGHSATETSRSYKTSHQRSILRTWLNDHEGRYPNKAELNSLVKEVNASPGAVRRWFYNERVSVDKQNKKKQGQSATGSTGEYPSDDDSPTSSNHGKLESGLQ